MGLTNLLFVFLSLRCVCPFSLCFFMCRGLLFFVFLSDCRCCRYFTHSLYGIVPRDARSVALCDLNGMEAPPQALPATMAVEWLSDGLPDGNEERTEGRKVRVCLFDCMLLWFVSCFFVRGVACN